MSQTLHQVWFVKASALHSPARGLYKLHMGWGLLEPLNHSHLGAIVTMVETLIKSHIQKYH
jgi:hypothetical protein